MREEISELILAAMRKGEWRAAFALYDRVYGRPKEVVETTVVKRPQTLDHLDAMTPEERIQLLAELEAESEVISLRPTGSDDSAAG